VRLDESALYAAAITERYRWIDELLDCWNAGMMGFYHSNNPSIQYSNDPEMVL
jgi:hypothetical protein